MAAAASIPSWLQTSPDDIANKFVSGLQVGAQLGEARNKLAQQAQQSAVENQVTQDKLAADATEAAQKLQVQQAYNDQQISLKQQEVAAAQQKVALATAQAARMYQAQQGYSKDLEEFSQTMSKEDAARASFLKNMVPALGSTANLLNRGGAPAVTVVTDARGNKHNLAQIPGSRAFTDLDRNGGADSWQAHHDITRAEKLSDTQRAAQITDLRDQLKTASDPDEIKKIRSNLDSLLNPPAKSTMSIPTSGALTPNSGIQVTGPSSNVGLFNSPSAAPAAGNPYQVGRQYGKLRYKGGDPNNQGSWEPVQP